MTEAAASADFVQSLARGLAVIRAFDADARRVEPQRCRPPCRHATGRGPAVPAHPRDARLRARRRSAHVRAHPAGARARLQLPLRALAARDRAAAPRAALAGRSDESVSAAVLDGTDIVYVARVPTRRIMSVRITIGTRFPAYATSMGRVLLAGLPEDEADAAIEASALLPLTDRTVTDPAALRDELARVREQGWSLVDGELEPGLRSIAVPRARPSRVVVAAVERVDERDARLGRAGRRGLPAAAARLRRRDRGRAAPGLRPLRLAEGPQDVLECRGQQLLRHLAGRLATEPASGRRAVQARPALQRVAQPWRIGRRCRSDRPRSARRLAAQVPRPRRRTSGSATSSPGAIAASQIVRLESVQSSHRDTESATRARALRPAGGLSCSSRMPPSRSSRAR